MDWRREWAGGASWASGRWAPPDRPARRRPVVSGEGKRSRGTGRRPPRPIVGPVTRRDSSSEVDSALGERLDTGDCLIVAPAAGTFHPWPPDVVTAEGEIFRIGQTIGTV